LAFPGSGTASASPRSGAGAPIVEPLPADKITLKSALAVDLVRDFARLPIYPAQVDGKRVWYVITEVSDPALANRMGLNFAPRLKNLITPDCPGCVQTVTSGPVLGQTPIIRPGGVDFSPTRTLVPGPNGGFPPLAAAPGAVGSPRYSPFVRIAGTDIVFNAPIVASGSRRFDAKRHTNTHDRLLAINVQKRFADLNFVRAFAFGKDIFYLSFESSSGLAATTDRSTLVAGLGLSPAPDHSRDPATARSAIFAFTNGQRGAQSPPAQGLDHLIVDGLNARDLRLDDAQLLEALRRGGDAHNVLDSFPTLDDPALRALYSPLWDVVTTVWTPDAVRSRRNVAQTDANQIRQLAAAGEVTSPGGTLLRSDRFILNCPALAFPGDRPTGDQAPQPPGIP
jgi:hypothetical protein